MITPQDMYTINIQSRTFKERSLHKKTNYNKWISIEKKSFNHDFYCVFLIHQLFQTDFSYILKCLCNCKHITYNKSGN